MFQRRNEKDFPIEWMQDEGRLKDLNIERTELPRDG